MKIDPPSTSSWGKLAALIKPTIERLKERIKWLISQFNSPTSRLALLLVGLLFLLSLTFARFFILQVVQGDHWKELADRQHLMRIPQPFFRGSFWLSDPQAHVNSPLSYDLARFHLYVDCTQFKKQEKRELIAFLNSEFQLSPTQITRIEQQLARHSRSRRLLSHLDLSEKQAIEKWWVKTAAANQQQANAIYFIQDHLRSHPQNPLLGALVHTTQLLKDEKTQQSLPTGGLELYLDRRLQGKRGWRTLKRTLKNPLASTEKFVPAQHGSDITLTINPRLQAVAEKILQGALVRFQAKRAWAIAIDPYSGKILCLAQAPGFNLENYPEYFASEELAECAKLWGVSNAYEPGSVMKPITLAIALSANEQLASQMKMPLFDPSKIVKVRDGRLPGRKHALRDTIPVDCVDMNLGLQLSSNIYMAKLMHQLTLRLGEAWYQNKLLELGFGSASGIELPSESIGLVPTPGKVNQWGCLEWSQPTPGTLAMGHSILVNSLQLLRVYSALANGGWLIQPTLIQGIYTPIDQRMLPQYTATNDARSRAPKVFSLATTQRVLEAMSYTLKGRGSCVRADMPGYSLAAKTGTANKFFAGKYDPNHTISTFIGILPAHKPELVLLVSVDEPRYFFIPGQGYNHRASYCAAPIFHRIAQEATGILGIERDQPESYLPKDPRFDPAKAFWVQESRALQEIFDKWNSQGGNLSP